MDADYTTLGDRRITLEQLRAFVAVAETRGFLEAGRRLYRTQPAVTQSVKRLEEYLRCRLLERGQGQNTELTADGARFLPQVRDILARLDHSVNLLQRPELKGEIVVGMHHSMDSSELQAAISACMAVNKGLRIQVISELSFRLMEMMDHGLLDVIIICRNKEETVGPGTMRHLLRLESLVWVGQKSGYSYKGEEIPLAVSVEGCTNRQAAENVLKKSDIPYYFSFVSPSWESVCAAVTAGFGLTTIPRSEVWESHTILTVDDGLPPLSSLRTELRTNSNSPVIRQFCDLIKDLPAFREQA